MSALLYIGCRVDMDRSCPRVASSITGRDPSPLLPHWQGRTHFPYTWLGIPLSAANRNVHLGSAGHIPYFSTLSILTVSPRPSIAFAGFRDSGASQMPQTRPLFMAVGASRGLSKSPQCFTTAPHPGISLQSSGSLWIATSLGRLAIFWVAGIPSTRGDCRATPPDWQSP
jgi:hypothetical protein